jgi:hypothetical protein
MGGRLVDCALWAAVISGAERFLEPDVEADEKMAATHFFDL